jgi:flagellar assembly protein FliH
MSSEQVVSYAFPQLEAPPGGGSSPGDLLADAWAEAENIRESARQEGHAEGHAAGVAAARAEIDATIGALTGSLEQVEQLREELVTALEHDAAELAFKIAEQVLAGALEVQPDRVVDVARNALRRVTDRRRVILVVNPTDLEIVADAVQPLKAELGGIEHCDVQSDRRIARGGVVLRTEAGEIDVTLDAQLESAREIVAASLNGAGDES